MKKNLLYSIVTVILIGSLLAGCGNKEASNNQPSEDILATNTESSDKNTSDADSSQPSDDITADNTTSSDESSSDESSSNNGSDQSNKSESSEQVSVSDNKPSSEKNESESEKNNSNKNDSSSKHEHKYTEKITKTANCMTKGVKEFTCSCGDYYEEVIEKTGHVEGDWLTVSYPTCVNTGQKVKKCTVCETTLDTASIAKTAHTAGEWKVIKEATCSSTGTKIKNCTVCNVEVERATINSNGTHNYAWDTNGDTRTMKCNGCGDKGITEYNYNGVWGYFDDEKAEELWFYVNKQRESVRTTVHDDWGNVIDVVNVHALNKNDDLFAKAKKRAVGAALSFDHNGEQHECLAWGIGNPVEVKSAWVASQFHRVAMTNDAYYTGGVAWFYYDSDNSGENLTPIAVLELGY